MATLYLTEQGVTVTKTDGRLLVRKDGEILQELPAIHVDQIVVFGNAHFTMPAVNFILQQGIDVAYLSSHKARITEPALRQLLRAWLDVETVVVERTGVPRQEKPRGILQGGVLSPLFGNVYLDRFDKLALKQGLKLIRYGDDIVVCCRSKREAEATLKLVAKVLAKLDLRLNPHKTVIVHAEKGFHFLGERLFLKTEHNGQQRLAGWRSEAPQRALPALPPAAPRIPARLITDDDDV